MKICSVSDCTNLSICKTYCKKHYSRYLRNGDVLNARLHERHGKDASPENIAWRNMKARCLNKNHPMSKYYSTRNIKICDRWLHSFKNFYDDMGAKPSPEFSLDRIDNDKGYTPNNCRWADKVTQTRNRSITRTVIVNGKTIKLAEACENYNVSYRKAIQRLNLGWSVERTFGI